MVKELRVGGVYFLMKFADDELTIPLIATYEYKGKEPKDAEGLEYVFEDLLSGDQLVLRERDLKHMVDMPGLIDQLKRFKR